MQPNTSSIYKCPIPSHSHQQGLQIAFRFKQSRIYIDALERDIYIYIYICIFTKRSTFSAVTSLPLTFSYCGYKPIVPKTINRT
jgi:hypothetical protein